MAAGRPLTHIDRLIGCAHLFDYSVIVLCQSSLSAQSFSATSFPTRYLSLHTGYMYHPMAPISACNTSSHYLWTPRSYRVDSPVVHIHPQFVVVAMGCLNVIHRDVPIAGWALVSLD